MILMLISAAFFLFLFLDWPLSAIFPFIAFFLSFFLYYLLRASRALELRGAHDADMLALIDDKTAACTQRLGCMRQASQRTNNIR